MARRRFDLRDGEPFNIEVDGERFGYTDCYEFAVISDRPASVYSSVFKARSGRFARVTIIADEGAENNPYGIHKGWYSAYIVTKDEAHKIRESWAVLRPQPPSPGGPWA